MRRITVAVVILFNLVFTAFTGAYAQVPQVGKTIEFANMTLHLTDQAREDIQADVDALYRHPKYFELKLERVDLYMPIIEPILAKYNVPDDFKYLVIQESGLVPDAVSSSNAVGYWQFKETSATEIGMRVDGQVDERMNIVSATAGAARYLLRSNEVFDNWVYSLLSYNVGLGGATRSLDKKFYGANKMRIDDDTHWYIKKFLSHLVAFKDVVGKAQRNTVLYQYNNCSNKSLKHIAHEFSVDYEQVKAYNVWLKTSSVPSDRPYTVIIPLKVDESEDLLAQVNDKEAKQGKKEVAENSSYGHKQQYPKMPQSSKDKLLIVKFNDLEGVIAREEDDLLDIAMFAGLTTQKLKKYNDMESGDKVIPGKFYYFQKKRSKARVYQHVLQRDETLWDVAQKYGIRLNKLKQKNRIKSREDVKPGRVLWLRFIRPSSVAVEYRDVPAAKPNDKTLVASNDKKPIVEKTVATKQSQQKEIEKPASASNSNNKESGIEKKEENKVVLQKEIPSEESEKVKAARHPVVNQNTKQEEPKQVVVTGTAHKQEEVTKDDKPAQEEEEWFNINNQKELAQDTVNEKTVTRKVDAKKEEKQTEDVQKNEQRGEEAFVVDEPVKFINEVRDTVHIIKAGETLYSLSKRYEVSVEELIQWNNMDSANPVLKIGQALNVVPKLGMAKNSGSKPVDLVEKSSQKNVNSNAAATTYVYHTVVAGESMYRVARQYQVTIKDIMEWNNKSNFDIKEGEKLIVGEERKK